METHSNSLSGKISRTEKSGGLQSIGLQRVENMTEATEHSTAQENRLKKKTTNQKAWLYWKAIFHNKTFRNIGSIERDLKRFPHFQLMSSRVYMAMAKLRIGASIFL